MDALCAMHIMPLHFEFRGGWAGVGNTQGGVRVFFIRVRMRRPADGSAPEFPPPSVPLTTLSCSSEHGHLEGAPRHAKKLSALAPPTHSFDWTKRLGKESLVGLVLEMCFDAWERKDFQAHFRLRRQIRRVRVHPAMPLHIDLPQPKTHGFGNRKRPSWGTGRPTTPAGDDNGR
jgi:hypothetical protein